MSRRPSFFEQEPARNKCTVTFFTTDKVKSQVLALEILNVIRRDDSLTNEDLTVALIQVLGNVNASGVIAERLSDVFAFKRKGESPAFEETANVHREDLLASPTPFNTPILKPIPGREVDMDAVNKLRKLTSL